VFAPVWTLRQLTARVKRQFQEVPEFRDLHIEGEVTKSYHAPTGHLYFTLSDGPDALNCVAWRGTVEGWQALPLEGTRIVARGRLTIYGGRSQYQLDCRAFQPAGEGARAAMIEALRRKLTTEGLFDDEYKKELPHFPQRVAVVTAPRSAALRDVVEIAARRWPLAALIVVPATVQGSGCPRSVVAALERADALGADLLLLVRGGGAPEDLDGFNAEAVVRAVAGCRTPVVTGVGHEIDTTLVDHAADVRGATPSHAAELALPDRREVAERLGGARQRLAALLAERVAQARQANAALTHRLTLAHPRERLRTGAQRLDETARRLTRAMAALRQAATQRLARAERVLASLDPNAVLGRGYALVSADGKVLREPAPVGSAVEVRLARGEMQCQVTRTK